MNNKICVCKSCSKDILIYQSKIVCSACNCLYHNRCTYSDYAVIWFCFKCTGDLFPFNHYVEDDEFRFSLFCFNNTLEYNRMLALRLNPFKFEDDLRKSTNADLMNVDSNKCSYIFDNDTFSSSSDSDFSIIHLNTRSFNKNADVVNIFLSNIDHTFSVICISETWFYDDMSNVLNIKGYELVNAPRRDGRRGGGSAIYVHNSLTYRVKEDLTLITDPLLVMIMTIRNQCLLKL